jgi:xanthine/uracil/vitamin C permease (AzgA family)
LVVGGVTIFFTMAYVVVVNPQILSTEGEELRARREQAAPGGGPGHGAGT